MRIVGLLVLALLLPAFAYAALININTADATLLDTLPGIGPSKAAAIITYRNGHGPFAKIEDIQNVSGIGPSTYADIKGLITVGDTSVPDSGASAATSTTTSAATTTPVSGSSPEYIPIPILRVVTGGDRTVSAGADTAFAATVYDGRGDKRDDALVTWSFGDGMRKVGAGVLHQYYDPGEYLAVVHAVTPDGGNALAEVVVTVKDARLKIVSVSPRGVTLANDDSRTLDLSLWRLSMGGKEFKIPEETQILAGHRILLPSQVIELPPGDSAFLLYPSGEVAAAYPPALAGQPSREESSYKEVSEVEPTLSARADVLIHEEAVKAPTAANELAAVGAAVSPTAPAKGGAGIFKSPWTLGFLGVMALAGGALIFL